MLSATGDGGGRVDMRGNQMAQAPSAAKPSGGAYGGGGGRKLRVGNENENMRPMSNGTEGDEDEDEEGKEATAKKRRAPKTMEELDRRIEEDELALVNMKREIKEQQKVEIANSQKKLITIKKQYDVVHAQNKVLDQKLAGLIDKMNGYRSVDDAMHESNQETQTICRELTRKLASIEEMVNAEQRTLDMQRTMEKRLAGDTGALKLENGELTFKLDKMKYELNSSISTLQLSKVELAEKEKIMEEMHQQANVRRKDRAKRMELLHGIVDEGSNNLTMIHDAIYEEGKLHSPANSPTIGRRRGSPGGGANPFDLTNDLEASGLGHRPPSSPSRDENGGGNGIVGRKDRWAGPRIGSQGGLSLDITAVNGNGDEDDFDDEPVDSPRKVATRMNLDQIEDMVNRYRTRAYRMAKLEALEADLKSNISNQNSKSTKLTAKLEECRVKIEQLASARQIYQEVDHKNSALSGARKMHDEYKEKEYNMRVNLAALKRAIPRLVAKMTKSTTPVPSDAELADSLHKLSAELLKYIKEIQQTVAKEYSPEELSLMQARLHAAQQKNLSELDRLVNMPGFQKMQTEIYFNMMGARPDLSANNVRIHSEVERKKQIAAQEAMHVLHDHSPVPSDSKEGRKLSLAAIPISGGINITTEGGSGGSNGPSSSSSSPNSKAEMEARKTSIVSSVRKSLDDGVDVIASMAHHSEESWERGDIGHEGKGDKLAQGGGGGGHGGGNSKSRASVGTIDHTVLIPEPPVIDRTTAKAISMLVLERDGKGIIPEKPKPKAKKKKPYKMAKGAY